MEFWVIALVVTVIVIIILNSRFRAETEEKFEHLHHRLQDAEAQLSTLRREHAALVARVGSQSVEAQAPPAAAEPLAGARVIVVDAPPQKHTAPPAQPPSRPASPQAPPFKPQPPVRPAAPVPPPPSRPAANVPLSTNTIPDWVREHPITREIPPRPPKPPLADRMRSTFDLEQKLGANYLAKLGVGLLVVGIALFLIYQFGGTPAGKIFLGYLGGTLGLAGGFWLERKERYRTFARSLMGGGWALLYFTTYAMHHVAAARILASQPIDLVLMLVVAAGMVAHSLTYRSQVVTGLAFTLAFLTVTLSHSDVYSLSAGAVLALALVVITARLRWFELEVFGLLAAYINHFLWLFPYVSSHTLSPQLFAPSTALLAFYWAAFRGSYVLRKVADRNEEAVSTLAAILNSVLVLGLMKYQSLHPEWAFYALLAFGMVELVLGELPITRRRRTAFLILTTIGVALIVAAFPFRYSDASLSLTWLVASQLLLIAGILTREVHFRRLGLITAFATFGAIVFQAGSARLWELAVRAPSGIPWHEGLVFAIAAIVFYLDAHLVTRVWRDRTDSEFERVSLRGISYLAFVLTIGAIGITYDLKWFAMSIGGLALGFAILAAYLRDADFVVQAPLYSAIATIAVVGINTNTTDRHFALTFRAIAYSTVAAAIYVAAFFHGRTERDEASQLRAVHTWTASVLIATLIWYEIPAVWIAVAWTVLSLALMAASRVLKQPTLKLQSNVAAIAAIVRAALFNLPATGLYHHDALRLWTVVSVAAALYAGARWADTAEYAWTRGMRHVYTGAASVLVTVLAWYELQPTSVVPAWAVYGLLLFEAGMAVRSLSLRVQGYAVVSAAFVRIFFVNLNATGGGWLSPRVYTIAPLALALYYLYARVLSSRDVIKQEESKLADFAVYFAAATIASLLRFEVAADWVAASWATLAVLAIAAALVIKRTAFEYQAIILAGAVIVRGLMYNIAQRSALAGEHSGVWPVGTAVGLTLLALPFAFYLRSHGTESQTKTAPRILVITSEHPEQFFFFIPVALLTVLLWVELPTFRTIAWGVEGMLVFLLALWAGERSFRLTGLGLLLLCVGKILVVDAWAMEPRDRYLTLIVLGMVLTTVSFLYNRYREALRKLL